MKLIYSRNIVVKTIKFCIVKQSTESINFILMIS